MRATIESKGLCVTRKCACCGETININKDNINDAIFYDRKYYHRKCFIEEKTHKEYREVKVLPQKEELLNTYGIDISKYKNGRYFVEGGKERLLYDFNAIRHKMFMEKEEEKKNLFFCELTNIEKKSYKHLLVVLKKEEINQFMMSEYDISIIPSSIWTKLGNIYAGTWRGMGLGIPPEDLLDMWKRKIDYLNKVANRNIAKGREMSADKRINYDLSILVNKYDGYLKWKESQKILESDTQHIGERSSIDTSIIKEVSKKSTDKSEEGEISDLVDDIFN